MSTMNPESPLAGLLRSVRARNRRELIAAVVVQLSVAGFTGLMVVNGHDVGLPYYLGLLSFLSATVLVQLVLVKFGRPKPAMLPQSPDSGVESLRILRRQQASLLTMAPVWYVLPLMLGAYAFLAGTYATLHRPIPSAVIPAILIVGVAVSVLNLRAARRLKSAL